MLGIIVLFVALGIEISVMVYSLKNRGNENLKRNLIKIISFVVFSVFILLNIIEWSFRWQPLFIILLVQFVMGIIYIIKKKNQNKSFSKKQIILRSISNCILLIFTIMPAIIFPQFEPLAKTGPYEVNTESYTLTYLNKIETYNDKGENRKISIQFWYPQTNNENETFPLVIFSHGAFGFRGSNYSTFMELASNGYVVCSIDHTYQSFFTKHEDGEIQVVNNDFLNDAIAAQLGDYDIKKTYDISQQWLKLRTDDMNLVLDTILENINSNETDEVYKLVDKNNIGLFGHSLGGATAASLGRERKDIDAVIVIDGTMLGEETGFENGKVILNKESYPTPILNIYNEKHFEDALANMENYDNMVASTNAIDASQTVFKNSGHLNFTDLPMFSPFLARKLGTGSIDSRYCIEEMNNVVLNYFDFYLKEGKSLNILNQY